MLKDTTQCLWWAQTSDPSISSCALYHCASIVVVFCLFEETASYLSFVPTGFEFMKMDYI